MAAKENAQPFSRGDLIEYRGERWIVSGYPGLDIPATKLGKSGKPDKRRAEHKLPKESCTLVKRRAFLVVNVQPLPCPCCGEKEPYFGVMSAMTWGVKCRSCRLHMERECPNNYPRGCKSLEDLYDLTLAKAIEAWNRRA